MFQGKHQSFTAMSKVGIGVPESVKIGGSPQGLTGLSPVFLGGMMDQDHGQGERAL
jgi:hypothetical protein